MQKYKKPLRFYLFMFIFAVILVIVYNVYTISTGTAEMNQLIVTWIMPFLFVGFYYGSDSLMEKFRKKKQVVDYEVNFLETISMNMRKSGQFLVEDFRKLKFNEKFQKAVKDAYHIYKDGESELYNFQRLEKKFKKDSTEYNAVMYVISFIKENQKNNQSE